MIQTVAKLWRHLPNTTNNIIQHSELVKHETQYFKQQSDSTLTYNLRISDNDDDSDSDSDDNDDDDDDDDDNDSDDDDDEMSDVTHSLTTIQSKQPTGSCEMLFPSTLNSSMLTQLLSDSGMLVNRLYLQHSLPHSTPQGHTTQTTILQILSVRHITHHRHLCW